MDDYCPSIEMSTQEKLAFPSHLSASRPERNNGMQVLYPRCCLDIHKKTVVACALLSEQDGTIHRFVLMIIALNIPERFLAGERQVVMLKNSQHVIA